MATSPSFAPRASSTARSARRSSTGILALNDFHPGLSLPPGRANNYDMLKHRSSRLFASAFGLSTDRLSSRSLKDSASRPSTARHSICVEAQPSATSLVEEDQRLDILPQIEEPLFEDSYISAPKETDELPAPPSAALAAKWNEFLSTISTDPSSSTAEQGAEEEEKPEEEYSGSVQRNDDLDYYFEDTHEYYENDDYDDLSSYFQNEVATPIVFRFVGRPKMVDIHPASMLSSRARSSSHGSSLSAYSERSTLDTSPPGTPLSATYDSDNRSPSIPGSFPLESGLDYPEESKFVSKRHARDMTGSFLPVVDDDIVPPLKSTSRPSPSQERTRVWFR